MGPGTRRARVRLLTSLLAVVGLAACLAAPAAGQDGGTAAAAGTNRYAGQVGMNAHMVWYDQATIEATYQSMRQGGVDHAREDFPWQTIEPNRGQHSWSRTDTLMAAASRTGMEVSAILAYSTPWSTSVPGNVRALPANDADYAAYAEAVVRRYGLGGTFWRNRPELEPQPIRSVEIWNEPSGYWNANPEPDPARYARLSLAAAEAIHRVDPAMTVLIDATLLQVRRDGQMRTWLQQVLAAEPRLHSHIGALAAHPYPHPPTRGPYAQANDARWDFSQVEIIRDTAAAAGVNRPVWITEVGWSTATQAPGTVSEAQQAEFLVQAVERALDDFGSFVPRIYLYSFDRDGNDPTDREGFFGVRRRDGTPKPAWTALRQLLTTPTAAPPAPTTPVTASPSQPVDQPEVRLGPSRLAVRVYGSVLYYDL